MSWKAKYDELQMEHRRTADEKFRMLMKVTQLERHNRTLMEIIERLMDPNRTFKAL